MQGGLKLEIRISNSNTWKRHSQHQIGLFVFTRSNRLIIGGKMLDYRSRSRRVMIEDGG